MKKITYFSVSEQGRRENNEDLCLTEPLADGKYLLAVICDGVGGENGGEVASYIAAKTLRDYLTEYRSINIEMLRMGLIAANNAIIELQTNPRYEHMSTCVSSCILSPGTNELHICHVGDTRVYAYNRKSGKLSKLTADHSYVGHIYDTGKITERQAMNHPKRNRIDRCLGACRLSYFDDYIYAVTIPLEKIDRLLLCSDGLYDIVSSEEMKQVLVAEESPEIAAEILINKALSKGSHDNISTIVINR